MKARYMFLVFAAMFIAVLCFNLEAEALSLSLNFPSIDFGNMNMGDFKDEVPTIGLIVSCSAASTTTWNLKIRTDYPLTHTTNPTAIIPNTVFKWYGVSTTTAGNTSLVTTRQDFTVEKNVYTGLTGEPTADITMRFELTLPAVLQSGTYTSNIVFTLTQFSIQ